MTPQPELDPVDGLAQLSFVIMGMLERRAAEHELSIPATRLLGVLRDREPTMQELARFLDLDKSSVTGLVDRAERRGLVARATSPADRRATLVRLTDEGRALMSAAAELFATDVTALLGQLAPQDRAALSQLISRLLVAHAAAQGIDLFATTTPQGTSHTPGLRLTAGATSRDIPDMIMGRGCAKRDDHGPRVSKATRKERGDTRWWLVPHTLAQCQELKRSPPGVTARRWHICQAVRVLGPLGVVLLPGLGGYAER